VSQRREPPPIAGKVPPHDLDAEAAVLSACLLDSGAREEAMGILSAENFYSDANKLIFGAIADLTVVGGAVDIATVGARLRETEQIMRCGGVKYLAKIVDATPAIGNVEAHARIVWSKWKRRRLISACHELLGYGYGSDHDDPGYVDFFDATVSAVLGSGVTADEPRALRDVLADAVRQIETSKEHAPTVSTGLADLNYILGGGYRPGQLIVVAARPGMGKTAKAVSNLVGAATPCDRGIYGWAYGASLEMDAVELGVRMLASEARADTRRLGLGELPYKSERTQQIVSWDTLTPAAASLARLPVYLADRAYSFQRIAADARKLARKAKRAGSRLALVVVDYLQIMETKRGERRDLEIQLLTRGLKLLAKELACPVVLLSQLNRDVEKRKPPRPMLSDLRDSGSIEQDADVVLFLYRQEYYEPDNADARGKADIIVAKQRNGPTGFVEVAYVNESTRFENLGADRWAPTPEAERAPAWDWEQS
jgi:replicative DNA helicase